MAQPGEIAARPVGEPQADALRRWLGRGRRGLLNTRTLGMAAMLPAWWLLSLWLGEQTMPGPVVTLQALSSLVAEGAVFADLGITLFRIFAGFAVAMTIGVAVGVLMGLSRWMSEFFSGWIAVGLSVPALIYIVVSYLSGLGLSEQAAIVAIALCTIFIVIYNIWEGVKSIDRKLVEMAQVHRASRLMVLRHVLLPQISPFIMASAKTNLGITWRITTFVELMGRPDGMGYQIYHYFQIYNITQVFAHAALFIIVMLIIEAFIAKVIEPWLFAWRPPAKA
jgi:NitT/TauT family transport system permease protein